MNAILTLVPVPDPYSDALALLSAALDAEACTCIVGLKAKNAPIHAFFAAGDYDRAVAKALALDADGYDAYWATSTFVTNGNRTAKNVAGVKVLKLDVDVGKGDGSYATKKDAVQAVCTFAATITLPLPTFVDSGNGVHAYWILETTLTPAEGAAIGTLLKGLCHTHKLLADPTSTADIARILRVPGTHNRKNPDIPKPVRLKGAVQMHPNESVVDVIRGLGNAEYDAALATRPVELFSGGSFPIPQHLIGAKIDDTTRSLVEGKPKKFSIIMKKTQDGRGCAQLKYINDEQAEMSEPMWQAGLSIAWHCEDGEDAIHALSKIYPGYDHGATVKKAQGTVGPRTCAWFQQNRPEGCDGCKFAGRITSPIQLGSNDDEQPIDIALSIVQDAVIQTAAGDVGAPCEPHVIQALQEIKKADPAEYLRQREAFKQANRNISLGTLDQLVGSDDKKQDRTIADLLIVFARENCDLFHDPDNEPYATFDRGGHRECWHLKSKGFREYLSHEFYKMHRSAPAEPSIVTALDTLAGQAQFEGQERPVAVRVAKHGTDYYLDLCDDQWQAVRVTPSGWQVMSASPVMFVRNSAMRPLPHPIAGGSLDALWRFANISEDDRLLLLAWYVESLRPDTPYPVLELFAEQGSAKSFTQSVIRELIDPNKANLRAKPNSIHDLFVSAKTSHVTSLENLSHLPPDYQDALCSLATGAGYGGRALYTDAEESIFQVKRPIMLNGISIVVTAQDLMDRTLLINLPRLTERRTELELNADFGQEKAQIFGALLALFSRALKLLPTVQIDSADRPRMADFAHIGEAVFQALGCPPGRFLAAYLAKRRQSVAQTIEANPVAAAVTAWLDVHSGSFAGTVAELQQRVSPMRPVGDSWPKSAKGFADALRRVAPALRLLDIDVQYQGHRRDGHHYTVRRMNTADPSNSEQDGHNSHDGHA